MDQQWLLGDKCALFSPLLQLGIVLVVVVMRDGLSMCVLLHGSVSAVADRVGGICLAEEVGPPQKEEEMGVEAENDDKDDTSWHKAEDGGKGEASGEGTVATSEAKSTESKRNGVDDKGDKPEDGPKPPHSLLHSKGEGRQRVDQDNVGDEGDGQVPEVLREDGAGDDVAKERTWRVVFD